MSRCFPLVRCITAACVAVAAACGGPAYLPLEATVGPAPSLAAPRPALIPMVRVAKAVGWKPGQAPAAADGLRVTAFASGLDHPRWIHVLPNGDVLVAESSAPPKPSGPKTLKQWAFSKYLKYNGSAVPSADRITLLRDTDGDGVADVRSVFLDGLHSPFGMALVGSTLYVGNTDAVVRVPYVPGSTRSEARPEQVLALPAGDVNYHWTKNLLASPDGRKLYVAIGSNSNVGERGLTEEAGRAAIWELDLERGTHRVHATGLRNPVGMTWVPARGSAPALWVAVNERDELGSDLVPDYMTAVHDGGFYGWPFSYWGGHIDPRVEPARPDLAATAIAPDYALGAHTAPLGLAWSDSTALGARFGAGVFVGQHGSWNRYPPSGYRVVFVPFRDGRPAGMPVDVLTGFVADGEARGRPVGVAPDGRGGLLVADDVGNTIWRVHR